MEYMLLSDGSIKLFKCIANHHDVVDALHSHGGVAYYWWNISFNWSCITTDYSELGGVQVSADTVPDIIKLAAMLE